jgi:hypothetical protein
MELEDSVFTAGKFQHVQALRRAKIKFDVTSAKPRDSPAAMPIIPPRIAKRIALTERLLIAAFTRIDQGELAGTGGGRRSIR